MVSIKLVHKVSTGCYKDVYSVKNAYFNVIPAGHMVCLTMVDVAGNNSATYYIEMIDLSVQSDGETDITCANWTKKN